MSLIYLNGDYIPASEAKISPFDRGFLFGDSVYEVITIYNGHPFHLELHLKRLSYSLEQVRIPNPHTLEKWQNIIHTLIAHQVTQNLSLYLQVSRGAEESRQLGLPDNLKPTVLMSTRNFHVKTDINEYEPTRLKTCKDIRWQRCDIKSNCLLPNMLLRQEAINHHASEALLIKNGKVIEGASSNVFIVKSGTIITPPIDERLLSGTTRSWVLSLANTLNIPTQETELTLAQVMEADEVWISSTSRDIVPATYIDDNSISDGRIGPIWQKMITALLNDRANWLKRQI